MNLIKLNSPLPHDSRLIQTPHYYGQSALSQEKDEALTFSLKFNRVCLYLENQYTATKDSLREKDSLTLKKSYAQTNTFIKV